MVSCDGTSGVIIKIIIIILLVFLLCYLLYTNSKSKNKNPI